MNDEMEKEEKRLDKEGNELISLKEEKEIKERIVSGNFPDTRAEAIRAEAKGDLIGAGLFWGLISAQRRTAHWLAREDVEYAANLLGILLPEKIKAMKGLQMGEEFAIWLKKELGVLLNSHN